MSRPGPARKVGTLTSWKCPGCALTIVALAIAAGHRCPSRRHHWVDLVPIDDDSQPPEPAIDAGAVSQLSERAILTHHANARNAYRTPITESRPLDAPTS